MFNKIKAVKELRSQAKQMQKVLDDVIEVGQGAGGQVKVTMNGNQKIIAVQIDDGILENKSKLEEGVRDAVNDVVKKIQKEMAGKMKDMGNMQEMMKTLGM